MLAGGKTHEAVVALDDDSLASFEHVPGVQAAITGDEYAESEIAVKADPGFRRALELRGIHDVDLVMVDSWSVGLFEEPGRRVARALSWLRSDLTGDNGYARPIGGLIALVDLNTMQVVRIDDHGALPVPDAPGDYRNGGGRPYRDDLRPIEVTQPEGASFTLDGYALTWGPWRAAHRLQPARVADAARARLRRGRRRRAAADRPPALDRRARDPVCRHQSDRGLQERIRHRRVRPGGVRQLARARLRLPRRDPLPGRGRARQRGARADDPQRHLRTRGGHRHPLEALRLAQRRDRRAPCAPARDLLDRDRRQLRVRVSTGTSRWTARSPSSPSSPASCTPPASSRAPSPARPRSSRPASARATTSTSSARGSISTSTASATCSTRSTRGPTPPGRPTRTTSRSRVRQTPLASELAAQRLIDPLSGRRWRVANPRAATTWDRPSPTSSCPVRTSA